MDFLCLHSLSDLDPKGAPLAGRRTLLETAKSNLFKQSFRASRSGTSSAAYSPPPDSLLQLNWPPSLYWQYARGTRSPSDLWSSTFCSKYCPQPPKHIHVPLPGSISQPLQPTLPLNSPLDSADVYAPSGLSVTSSRKPSLTRQGAPAVCPHRPYHNN